jgi:hypothetical protein
VWAKRSGSFSNAGPTTSDVNAETQWNPGAPTGAYAKREGAPFAILDTIYEAEKTIRKADPLVVFPLLHMMWSPSNQPCGGAAGCPGGTAAGQIGTTAYHSDKVAIFVLGAQNVDTDEYDAQVMLHEYGHYFEDKFSRSDSVGGSHANGNKLDPRLAFGEGFATAHASMLSGDPLYVDTSGPNQASPPSVTDVEADSRGDSSFFSEDGIIELLWDLYDAKSATPEGDTESGGTIQDDVELGYKPIYDAMRGGEKNTPAFTSIYSFLKAVNGPYMADPALAGPVGNKIIALATAEGVDLANADEYEQSTRTLYTVLPPTGTAVTQYATGPFAGTNLSTRTTNDPGLVGNKLDDYVFFKVHIVVPGNYEIEVVPTNNKAMLFRISDHGKDTNSPSASKGATSTLPVSLVTGDYVVAVRALDFVGGQWVPTTGTFTIKLSLKSLFTSP